MGVNSERDSWAKLISHSIVIVALKENKQVVIYLESCLSFLLLLLLSLLLLALLLILLSKHFFLISLGGFLGFGAL